MMKIFIAILASSILMGCGEVKYGHHSGSEDGFYMESHGYGNNKEIIVLGDGWPTWNYLDMSLAFLGVRINQIKLPSNRGVYMKEKDGVWWLDHDDLDSRGKQHFAAALNGMRIGDKDSVDSSIFNLAMTTKINPVKIGR